jgi:hypothetical protein
MERYLHSTMQLHHDEELTQTATLLCIQYAISSKWMTTVIKSTRIQLFQLYETISTKLTFVILQEACNLYGLKFLLLVPWYHDFLTRLTATQPTKKCPSVGPEGASPCKKQHTIRPWPDPRTPKIDFIFNIFYQNFVLISKCILQSFPSYISLCNHSNNTRNTKIQRRIQIMHEAPHYATSSIPRCFLSHSAKCWPVFPYMCDTPFPNSTQNTTQWFPFLGNHGKQQ